MTGEQLYERVKRLGTICHFDELIPELQDKWNQLAQEASANVADEFALATHQERNRL